MSPIDAVLIGAGLGAGVVGTRWLLHRLVFKRAARRIIATVDDTSSEPHVLQPVLASEVAGVDLDYYDAQARTLTEAGFTHIADIEDVTLTRKFPGRRTFVRVMWGDGGVTRAAIYCVPGSMKGSITRSSEFITEFSDGTSIITANIPSSRLLDPPPQFRRELVPPQMDLLQMLDLHRERLKTWHQRRPDAVVRPVHSFDDAAGAWQRHIETYTRHRKAVGGVSRDELTRLAGKDPRRAQAAGSGAAGSSSGAIGRRPLVKVGGAASSSLMLIHRHCCSCEPGEAGASSAGGGGGGGGSIQRWNIS